MQHRVGVERYVAVGDSLTEGKGDPYPCGSPRGFADVLALALPRSVASAAGHAVVSYANLARPSVRTREIHADQVPAAVASRPDLITVVAGVNDVIALRFDAAAIREQLTAVLADLRRGAPEATIITATLPDIGAVNALARLWRSRVEAVNTTTREAAEAHGIAVVDLAAQAPFTRSELAADLVHPSPEGHLRLARAFGAVLGVQIDTPAHMAGRPPREAVRRVVRTTVVAPRFITRRLARRALIAGQPGKRPELVPL